MKNKIIYLAALLIFTSVYAQVNTEKHRTPEDMKGFAGNLELNANIKTGNTEKTEVGLEGRVDYRTVQTLTFLIFQTDYEWVGGSRSSDKGLIHARYVRNVGERFKMELFGQVNYDKKILIKNRELAGAGLRYKLFNLANGDIHFGTAYMFEHENYNLTETDSHPGVENRSRWSNYLTYYKEFNRNVIFSSVIYYQPAFNDFADTRVLNENHLNVGISGKFSVVVSFRLRYDSKPPDEIKDTDTETRVGVSLGF